MGVRLKQVTSIDALKDLSRYLRDMYCWADQFGNYNTGIVSVTRKRVKSMRHVVDAVLDSLQNGTPINVMDGSDGIYEDLCKPVRPTEAEEKEMLKEMERWRKN